MAMRWISETATGDGASSDATHRSNQVLRQLAPTHNTSNDFDRFWSATRVLRVLVVDGQRGSTKAHASRVRFGGHAVHSECDGGGALRAAAVQNPDVVLLDMDTPFVDGRQVARSLRSEAVSRHCLIIGVAERADDVRRQQCMESGIDLLLIKPVEFEVVETLLMLECMRVNRRWAPGATSDPMDHPSPDHRDLHMRSRLC